MLAVKSISTFVYTFWEPDLKKKIHKTPEEDEEEE